MGSLCCCCRESRHYADISHINNSNSKENNERELLYTLNLDSTIFKGLFVDQKFTNTSSFDKRFMWVNYDSKTLHMSQNETKEGRHKEASLDDIKGLDTKAPTKLRKKVDSEPGLKDDIYLTISFMRGGSIDLRFKTTAERNEWYKILSYLIGSDKGSSISESNSSGSYFLK